MTPERVVESLERLNYSIEDDEVLAPEELDRRSRVALITAAVFAAVVLVSLLSLAVGATVQQWREGRAYALVDATGAGDTARIRALIDRGADLDARGPDGAAPVEVAVRENHTEAASVLLASGAEATDQALRVAMGYGHGEMIRTLLEHGGNPNVRDTWLHRSLLEWAVEEADRESVLALLQAGADPNDTHALNMPALHRAASRGAEELVRLLLNHGASPSLRWHHQTPAVSAMLAGQDSLAERLAQLEGDL